MIVTDNISNVYNGNLPIIQIYKGDLKIWGTPEIELNVFIYYDDNGVYKLCDYNEIPSGDPVGICVKDKDCSFMMSLSRASGGWLLNTKHTRTEVIPNVSTAHIVSDLQKLYNGRNNTNNIVAFFNDYDTTNWAAGYCYNYRFKDGSKGYLPDSGEFYKVYQYKEQVNTALINCGKTALPESRYWVSTQTGFYKDDGYNYFEAFNFSTGGYSANSGIALAYVVPFTEFPS